MAFVKHWFFSKSITIVCAGRSPQTPQNFSTLEFNAHCITNTWSRTSRVRIYSFRSFNQTSKSTNKHNIQATRMLEVQWLAFAGKFLCDLSGKKAKVWGSKLYQADLLKFTGKPDQCTMLVKFCQGLFISLMVDFHRHWLRYSIWRQTMQDLEDIESTLHAGSFRTLCGSAEQIRFSVPDLGA